MLDRLVACLAAYQPEQVWLFGSYARGDYHAASDIDLIIGRETPLPLLSAFSPIRLLAHSLILSFSHSRFSHS